jgi:hypothetical protein
MPTLQKQTQAIESELELPFRTYIFVRMIPKKRNPPKPPFCIAHPISEEDSRPDAIGYILLGSLSKKEILGITFESIKSSL